MRKIWLAALLALAGCKDDETTAPEPEVTPDADACEHLTEGPFDSATASATAMDAPEVSESHTAWEITLPDDGSGAFGGYVAVAIDEAIEVLFFTAEEVDLAIEDADGNAVDIEASCQGAACASECEFVGGKHTVDIPGVGTYRVLFGPTDSDTVTLVHFEAGGEHHH